MGDLVSLNRSSLEDALNMMGWGAWARATERLSFLDYQPPGWTRMMISGYRQWSPVVPISDEYAEKLEKTMNRLDKQAREVLYLTYVVGASFPVIRRKLRCSNQTIQQVRDSALSYLYAKLCD